MKKIKLIALHILAAAILVFLVIWGCPFRKLTGFPCPFCGMTRAYCSLLRFDIAGAFHWHPLYILGVPTLLYASHRTYMRKKLGNKADTTILIALGAAFALTYILRIIFYTLPV
jgi:hypothetical protein